VLIKLSSGAPGLVGPRRGRTAEVAVPRELFEKSCA